MKVKETLMVLLNSKVYKGNVTISGRKSNSSLYSTEMATFEEDSEVTSER